MTTGTLEAIMNEIEHRAKDIENARQKGFPRSYYLEGQVDGLQLALDIIRKHTEEKQ